MKNLLAHSAGWTQKCWLSYLLHTCNDRRFDIHSIDEQKGTMAKSDRLLFKYGSPMSPSSLQRHGWWCGSDRARVTSRLLSGPCKQSRPMTCSIMPFEEEASSVMMKKNLEAYPLLTIGSSSRLQRGKQGKKKTASASMVTGQL